MSYYYSSDRRGALVIWESFHVQKPVNDTINHNTLLTSIEVSRNLGTIHTLSRSLLSLLYHYVYNICYQFTGNKLIMIWVKITMKDTN